VDSQADDQKLTATTRLTVGVRNAEHLRILMTNLKKVRSVNEVERVIQ
jgi:GTP pyrophosphokinase